MQNTQVDQSEKVDENKTRRDVLKTLVGVTSTGMAAAALGSKSLFAQAAGLSLIHI